MTVVVEPYPATPWARVRCGARELMGGETKGMKKAEMRRCSGAHRDRC